MGTRNAVLFASIPTPPAAARLAPKSPQTLVNSRGNINLRDDDADSALQSPPFSHHATQYLNYLQSSVSWCSDQLPHCGLVFQVLKSPDIDLHLCYSDDLQQLLSRIKSHYTYYRTLRNALPICTGIYDPVTHSSFMSGSLLPGYGTNFPVLLDIGLISFD